MFRQPLEAAFCIGARSPSQRFTSVNFASCSEYAKLCGSRRPESLRCFDHPSVNGFLKTMKIKPSSICIGWTNAPSRGFDILAGPNGALLDDLRPSLLPYQRTAKPCFYASRSCDRIRLPHCPLYPSACESFSFQSLADPSTPSLLFWPEIDGSRKRQFANDLYGIFSDTRELAVTNNATLSTRIPTRICINKGRKFRSSSQAALNNDILDNGAGVRRNALYA